MSLLLRDMGEADLVDTILDYAKAGGWLRTHFRAARTGKGYRTPLQGDKGYPDITLVHRELKRLIIAECKSRTGRLAPEQVLWRNALEVVPGIEYYLWKPDDLPAIRETLLGHRIGRDAKWA